MLKVLSADTVHGPTNAQRQEAAVLKDLVLQCIVRMIHVIHESSPDQVCRVFAIAGLKGDPERGEYFYVQVFYGCSIHSYVTNMIIILQNWGGQS